MKTPGLETTGDRAASEADLDELPTGDDAVLAVASAATAASSARGLRSASM